MLALGRFGRAQPDRQTSTASEVFCVPEEKAVAAVQLRSMRGWPLRSHLDDDLLGELHHHANPRPGESGSGSQEN
jgi:hypothetical protein